MQRSLISYKIVKCHTLLFRQVPATHPERSRVLPENQRSQSSPNAGSTPSTAGRERQRRSTPCTAVRRGRRANPSAVYEPQDWAGGCLQCTQGFFLVWQMEAAPPPFFAFCLCSCAGRTRKRPLEKLGRGSWVPYGWSPTPAVSPMQRASKHLSASGRSRCGREAPPSRSPARSPASSLARSPATSPKPSSLLSGET